MILSDIKKIIDNTDVLMRKKQNMILPFNIAGDLADKYLMDGFTVLSQDIVSACNSA